MTQMHWALLVSALSVALVAMAVLGARGAEASRAVRRVLAGAAALGGIALFLLSIRDTT